MKNRGILIAITPLIPILAVVALAVFGIVFDLRVYLLLGLICPVVAVFLWFYYRDGKKH
ncbi:MAG: hypothetical protein HY755_09960 [Nitrospirae bacterium]|nr:hypothetical protein [Nitrospirota bacterium]